MVFPASRKRRLIRIALTIVGAYLIGVAGLVITESNLVYQPYPGPAEPVSAGLPNFTKHTLRVPHLPTITYWENQATPEVPTLFYFHGNGGGLHLHTSVLDFLDQAGLHIIAIEYPGYPGAEGKPREATIIAQAIALWDEKATATEQPPAIWGFSLGSGVAIQLAAERTPSALILEAPFTAAVDRAAELFPVIPVRHLMHNTYRSRDYIPNVKAPIFIMHGDQDGIIPIYHGRALFALAREPKQFKEYGGFGHLDLIQSPAYDDALAFIGQYTH